MSVVVHATLLSLWRVGPEAQTMQKHLSIELVASPAKTVSETMAAACCRADRSTKYLAAQTRTTRQPIAAARMPAVVPTRLARRPQHPTTRAAADVAREVPTVRPAMPRLATLAATAPNPTVDAADKRQATGSDTMPLDVKLRSHLLLALREHLSYPAIARRYGWQGTVEMRLRIEADGRVSRIVLVHSSGYTALDQAALTSTRKISALAGAAGWLHGNYIDLLLPVKYRLIDG